MGAIFNVIPIAQLLNMSEESIIQLTKSKKEEDEQLEIVLEHWSKKNSIVEDLATLRKALESLKREGWSMFFFSVVTFIYLICTEYLLNRLQ